MKKLCDTLKFEFSGASSSKSAQDIGGISMAYLDAISTNSQTEHLCRTLQIPNIFSSRTSNLQAAACNLQEECTSKKLKPAELDENEEEIKLD
jgi:hypothetical protein